MLTFFSRLPNIYIVFAAFLVGLVAYIVTKDANLLPVVIGLGGSLSALANRTSKGEAAPDIKSENFSLSFNDSSSQKL